MSACTRWLLCMLLVVVQPGGVPAAGVNSPPASPASSPPAVAAALSPRETLRKAIEPMVDVFAREPDGPNRAVSLRLRLAESTNQPPGIQGSVLAFRAQPPDKVYCQFASVGTVVTVGRQGQKVWVSPASRLRPLLEQAQQTPATKEERQPLAALRLKVPKVLFWLAFRFAGLRDGGSETLGGVAYRKVQMNPPDEKAAPDKWLRLWVRADDSQLRRVEWHNPDYRGLLVIEDLKLSASLPDEAFGPDAAQRADMMEVSPTPFHQLMNLLAKEEEKRAKAQVAEQKAEAAAGR